MGWIVNGEFIMDPIGVVKKIVDREVFGRCVLYTYVNTENTTGDFRFKLLLDLDGNEILPGVKSSADTRILRFDTGERHLFFEGAFPERMWENRFLLNSDGKTIFAWRGDMYSLPFKEHETPRHWISLSKIDSSRSFYSPDLSTKIAGPYDRVYWTGPDYYAAKKNSRWWLLDRKTLEKVEGPMSWKKFCYVVKILKCPGAEELVEYVQTDAIMLFDSRSLEYYAG